VPGDERDRDIARILEALKPKEANSTRAVIERNHEIITKALAKGYTVVEIATLLAQSEHLKSSASTLTQYIRKLTSKGNGGNTGPSGKDKRVATTRETPTEEVP